MYSTSIQLFIRLLPVVAFAIVGEMVIQLVKETSSVGSGLIFCSVLVWSYLAFSAHVALLLPEVRDKSGDNKLAFGFALRTFGLGSLMGAPVIVGIVMLFSRSLGPGGMTEIGYTHLAGIGILLAVCFLLVFGLLGTLLPAFVFDRGRGLGAAFSRGVSQFFWICGNFLFGPVPIYALSLLVIVGGLLYLDPDSNMLDENYIPNVPVFLCLIVGYLIQALVIVMIAWVLSTGYKRAEGLQ